MIRQRSGGVRSTPVPNVREYRVQGSKDEHFVRPSQATGANYYTAVCVEKQGVASRTTSPQVQKRTLKK